ncbi:hypothetical protein L1987_61187 [Smallanthus sonchifolius]|uniref:Uncharacterized protein n=1 Tax=Smallanthus sonchifolius TaxID=185202 RepID=A0ACB9DAC1_9ASTR|nr:hypothetical protein L1987_61187 [Smallanthus sonchifolius]
MSINLMIWGLKHEKYETAASLAEMEKRVVMAESMLEATLQYQSGQTKAQPSLRYNPYLEVSKRAGWVWIRSTHIPI